MAGGVLPIFAGESARAAEALSEPFLRPHAFRKNTDRSRSYGSSVVAISTVYLAEGGDAPTELAISINPENKFDAADSASAFVQGYHDRLDRLHGMASLLEQGGVSAESRAEQQAMALEVLRAGELLTVAAVAIVGTPQNYISELVIPGNLVDELPQLLRDQVLRGDHDEEAARIDPATAEAGKRAILTQDPALQLFCTFTVASFFPRSDRMEEIVAGKL